MSVSFGYAFRFDGSDGPLDLLGAYSAVNALRPYFRERVHLLMARSAAELALETIDKIASTCPDEPVPRHMFSDACDKIRARQKQITATQHRDPTVDPEIKVLLFPFEGRVYGRVFTDQGEWARYILDQPWALPYGYQDSTDRPKTVTAREWRERRRVWLSIHESGPEPTPDSCSLTVNLEPSPYFWPKVDQLVQVSPPPEVRARKLARDRLRGEFSRAPIRALYDATPPGEFPCMSGILRVYEAASEWLASEEGQARLSAETGRLAALLPVVTRELITGNAEQEAA